jgi:hypothetical protein
MEAVAPGRGVADPMLESKEMNMTRATLGRLTLLALIAGLTLMAVSAGVRKEIQNDYVQRYKNRTMFLKIPVRGFRQTVFVGDTAAIDRSNASQPLSFKVGEQVRIIDLRFTGATVDIKIAATDMSRESELIFKFPAELENEFPEKPAFESALAATFTPGLTYSEIDSAKETFIKDQFDDLIGQFATSTGTSPEFVIKTISEKNPEYRQAQSDAREARARSQELEQQARDEAKARRDAEAEAQSLRRDLNQTRSSLNATRDERTQLANDKSSLQREVTQLQTRNQEYDRQVNDLVKSLGLQPDSRANLGKRVEAVSRSFDSLSQKLGQVNGELESLRANNAKLLEDLKQAERTNSKLASDLHSLTSDRNSLEARYLRTRREREAFANADLLARSFRLQRRREDKDGREHIVSDVYLLTKKLATLDVQTPVYPEDSSVVVFSVVSPDTVQFTEEERELHQLLGAKLKVETSWKAQTGDLKPALIGPAVQEIAARESGRWTWRLAGRTSEAQKVTFRASLVDVDGQTVPLDIQEFVIYPAGTWNRLTQAFSVFPFGLGVLAGGLLLSLVWLFASRRKAPGLVGGVSRSGYVTEKRL